MSGEPVAWAYVNDDGECEEIAWGGAQLAMRHHPEVTPLYTRPDELIEALRVANSYLINIGRDQSIPGKLIRQALSKWGE